MSERYRRPVEKVKYETGKQLRNLQLDVAPSSIELLETNDLTKRSLYTNMRRSSPGQNEASHIWTTAIHGFSQDCASIYIYGQ